MSKGFSHFGVNSGSIARRLTLALVFLGITATLVTTAAQIYRDYQTELRLINSQLEDIHAIHGQSIATSLWHFSEKQIEIELQGLLNNPGVNYAEVKSIDGEIWATGEKITSDTIVNEIPLSYSDNGEDHILGSLLVIAEKQIIYDRIKSHALETLIYFGLWVTLLAGIQFLIFQQLVTRHLKHLAKYTSSISFDKQSLSSPLILERYDQKAGSVDELEQVVHAINHMQIQLTGSIEELQKLSRAVEASSSAVIITNTNGNIEYVNPKFSEITGYTKEEVMGQVPRILLQSQESPNFTYDEISQHLTSKGEWKGEFRNKRKDGSLYWDRASISCVKDATGKVTHYIGIQDDVTYEYELTEQLSFQASHDTLTGLINRYEFERRAKRLLATIKHDKDEHAMCYLDLDQFKVVNDTCGHTAGDELLRQLGQVLQSTVRHRDTLARLGGDEFGILMEHCSLDHAHRIAMSLQKTVQDFQFSWEGHIFKVGMSIGLVAITEAIPDLTELLKQADAACYMAKDLGRNRIHVYQTEDETLAKRHGEMQWVARIYQAMEENRFCLYAQAIEPLDNSTGKHYELLIRLVDEKGKIIPPGAFLPSAERYNLISKIDRWVIEKTFSLLENNPTFLKEINFCSINLSGQSITENDFLNFIITQLDESGIEGKKICFEITETAAISNLSTAIKFISTLKELGCQFALDDFGSGLSSFAYLKNLPVDYLKIDGMFIKDIFDDPIDHAMVKSINEIGHVMGMLTIAEFVENDVIKGMLKEIGVDYAQGYGIDKPQPFDELLARSNNVDYIKETKRKS